MDRFHGHYSYAVLRGKEVFVECGDDEEKAIQIMTALTRTSPQPLRRITMKHHLFFIGGLGCISILMTAVCLNLLLQGRSPWFALAASSVLVSIPIYAVTKVYLGE